MASDNQHGAQLAPALDPANAAEIERIRGVYDAYRCDPRARKRWDHAQPSNVEIFQERMRVAARLLAVHGLLPLAGKRILEVGCGDGSVLAAMASLGATERNLIGLDLLPERVRAASRQHPQIRFVVGNAGQMPFPDGQFDMALQFTLFSSILYRPLAQAVAREMCRVLTAGGVVLWYDLRFPNPWNPHVRPIRKREIAALFPGFDLVAQSVTVIPKLVSWLGARPSPWYALLRTLPFLRSHWLALLVNRRQ